MNRTLGIAPAFFVTMLAGATARADAAGDAALAKIDEAQNRAKAHEFQYQVINQEPGKAQATRALTVRIKGDKRYAEFTAPADMKGTKVLILSATEMYVYLPAFGKVRRLADDGLGQGFMGMTFSPNDFVTRYGDVYTGAVASENASQMQLVATPKPGQKAPYAKIEITVAKDRMLPTLLKYYDAAKKYVKTEERTAYTCEGNVCTASEQKMTDNTKSGAWTKMVRKSWKVNPNLSDDMFTKRSLAE